MMNIVNTNTQANKAHKELRFLIADDHALVRGGLAMMIDMASPGSEIIQANSLDQVQHSLAEDDQVDLLLLDLMMPGMEGTLGIKSIRESWPDIPIIIVSVNEDIQSIRQSMSAGAAGYIPKTSTPNITVSAIKLVLDGGIYIPPHVLNLDDSNATNSTNENVSSQDSTLTRRQLQVYGIDRIRKIKQHHCSRAWSIYRNS